MSRIDYVIEAIRQLLGWYTCEEGTNKKILCTKTNDIEMMKPSLCDAPLAYIEKPHLQHLMKCRPGSQRTSFWRSHRLNHVLHISSYHLLPTAAGEGIAAAFDLRYIPPRRTKRMERLARLERLISSLVKEGEALRQENTQPLADSSADLAALMEENNGLKQALDEERQLKKTMLERVDKMLLFFQDTAKGKP